MRDKVVPQIDARLDWFGTMNDVTITYLEMTDRAQLRPKPDLDPNFRVLEAPVPQGRFNRFLYEQVGQPWGWHDRLSWSEDQWSAYVEDKHLRSFFAFYGGAIAGYFELKHENEAVEIVYFGLMPEFTGRGFGGILLTKAIEAGWAMKPKRVWLHTCTLDHPAALPNYQARGLVVYRSETAGS